jgi:hypothetical protein
MVIADGRRSELNHGKRRGRLTQKNKLSHTHACLSAGKPVQPGLYEKLKDANEISDHSRHKL